MEDGLINYYWEQVWSLWNERGNPETLAQILNYLEKIQIYTSDPSTRAEAEKTSHILLQEQESDHSGISSQSTLSGDESQKSQRLISHPLADEGYEKLEDFLLVEKPKINFSQVAGLEQTKSELCKALDWPLRFNDLMKEYGLEPSKGILMFGPPGCGKTHIARCCAGEFGTNFVLANPSNIGSKWYGEAEKNVVRCFETARNHAPCILFIDEVDKLLRYESGSSVTPRVLAEFEIQMDGFEKHPEQIVVLMGTNEPWRLHPALVRRGRIDRIIYIGPPDEKAREEIFNLHLKEAPREGSVDFHQLALYTLQKQNDFSYSCSDIKEICRTAKEEALAESIALGSKIPVQMKHIQSAFNKVPPSISSKDLQKYEKWAKERASLIE